MRVRHWGYFLGFWRPPKAAAALGLDMLAPEERVVAQVLRYRRVQLVVLQQLLQCVFVALVLFLEVRHSRFHQADVDGVQEIEAIEEHQPLRPDAEEQLLHNFRPDAAVLLAEQGEPHDEGPFQPDCAALVEALRKRVQCPVELQHPVGLVTALEQILLELLGEPFRRAANHESVVLQQCVDVSLDRLLFALPNARLGTKAGRGNGVSGVGDHGGVLACHLFSSFHRLLKPRF